VRQRLSRRIASGATAHSYSAWVPGPPNKVGHVASAQLDADTCKATLAKVRGHLVEMPLLFLDKVNLMELSASVNPMTMVRRRACLVREALLTAVQAICALRCARNAARSALTIHADI
jgi:hypothetical protein